MEIANKKNSQGKTNRKKKNPTPEAEFQHELAACSRNNDLSGALALYETAVSENTRLTSYHFNTLLHICSSSLEALEEEPGKQSPAVESASFRIFEHMVASGIHPAEATITSMARIAAAKNADGGDLAFDLVRNMRIKYGVSPKLRTYGPALFAFCQRSGCADKAYAVEEHMVSTGVQPEEQEIAALLKVSSEARREERVYKYLQNLRKCVGCVGPSTAEIVERWFGSECAAGVGRESWDVDRIKDATLLNGGGWHGEGWLGKGKWKVHRSNISSEGCCLNCEEQLASVDIGRTETEKFAELVASLAMEREAKSNFKDFQEWMNNHADIEVIVDGANVAFYQQNFADGGFCLSQLKTVVCELFQRIQRKWPLVIMHNKRVLSLMENPSNRQLIEDWRAKGALYTTPNGSNDDWYWLYAAVRLKCLLVTNDEMRDHIFELLNRNIFSKWKERHQVRYTFVKGQLRLEMPPQYSVVMQESERGSWHVPLDDKCQDEGSRIWLCITRHLLHETSDEVGQTNHTTQSSANLLETQTAIESSVDCLTKCSSPVQLSNGKVTCITGKRKDRYSSPSNPFDQ